MKLPAALLPAVFSLAAWGQSLNCDLTQYKPQEGLKAEASANAFESAWNGERGEQLRGVLRNPGGQPTVAELAARKSGGV